MNDNVPFHANYGQLSYMNEDDRIYGQVPSQQQQQQQQLQQESDDDLPLDESIPHPPHITQQQLQHNGILLQQQQDDDDEEEDNEEEEEDEDEDEFGAGGAFANVGQGLNGRYKNMMMQYWQETINSIEHEEHDFKNHQLPLARIKKVMKTDEEVRMISAEAPILFAKGCDIFITELTMRAWIHAEENKRRTLQRSDIAALLQKSDMFDFLIDIVPREEEKPKRHSTNNNNNNNNNIPNLPTTSLNHTNDDFQNQ